MNLVSRTLGYKGLRWLFTILTFNTFYLNAAQVELIGSWLFDQPIQRCVFRGERDRYPIWLIAFKNRLRLFDSEGNSNGEVPFESGQGLSYAPNRRWFAIVDTRVNPLQVPPQAVYSFRVFNEAGRPAYIYANTFFLLRQRERALLEDNGTLLAPDGFHRRIFRILPDQRVDTLALPVTTDTAGLVLFRGSHDIYYTLTTPSLNRPEPEQKIRVTIYDRFFKPLVGADIPGVLIEVYPFPGKTAFLVEVDSLYHPRMFLYHGVVRLKEYPTIPERVRIASPEYALFLGSGGTQVVNADNGDIVMGFISTAERQILDGIYLSGAQLFVFITGKSYHLSDGRKAWGRFRLKLVDHSGREVFAGDIESWSPYRPVLEAINADHFGLIIHNGVFVYQVQPDE